ncbi:MAG: hypothetical protein D3908_00410 [Candidatus Electrothrix sp. AUS4]|nr:hypothetical protein [Candidatus Electrothrix sp. AUS4]
MPEAAGCSLVLRWLSPVFFFDIAIDVWFLWRKFNRRSMVMVSAEHTSDIIINYREHVIFRAYPSIGENQSIYIQILLFIISRIPFDFRIYYVSYPSSPNTRY